jgi:hypothetical protein
MELLETQDPEKKRLIETSEQHKRELEREVQQIATRSEQVIKNALIIGGTLAVTYLLVSQFTRSNTSSKKVKKTVASEVPPLAAAEPEEPSIMSKVGSKVVNAATLMLLEIAREKLTEYFKNRTPQA